MSEFNVRSDSVDVEQIMRQIRARIREKRGVDYTEEEIRELANVKLEKFLDPRGVRSELLEARRTSEGSAQLPPFEEIPLYATGRPLVRWLRRMLNPILKLFFNPMPVIEAIRVASREPLYYELNHNLVVETTRLSIELKNLKMRVESMSSRLDFDERRARALEGVVQYRPGAVPPLQPPTGAEPPAEAGESADRRTRRRRRRGRRRPGMGGPAPSTVGNRAGGSENEHSSRRDAAAAAEPTERPAEPSAPDRRPPDSSDPGQS